MSERWDQAEGYEREVRLRRVELGESSGWSSVGIEDRWQHDSKDGWKGSGEEETRNSCGSCGYYISGMRLHMPIVK